MQLPHSKSARAHHIGLAFQAGIIVCAIGPIVGLVLRAAGKGGKQKSGHHR